MSWSPGTRRTRQALGFSRNFDATFDAIDRVTTYDAFLDRGRDRIAEQQRLLADGEIAPEDYRRMLDNLDGWRGDTIDFGRSWYNIPPDPSSVNGGFSGAIPPPVFAPQPNGFPPMDPPGTLPPDQPIPPYGIDYITIEWIGGEGSTPMIGAEYAHKEIIFPPKSQSRVRWFDPAYNGTPFEWLGGIPPECQPTTYNAALFDQMPGRYPPGADPGVMRWFNLRSSFLGQNAVTYSAHPPDSDGSYFLPRAGRNYHYWTHSHSLYYPSWRGETYPYPQPGEEWVQVLCIRFGSTCLLIPASFATDSGTGIRRITIVGNRPEPPPPPPPPPPDDDEEEDMSCNCNAWRAAHWLEEQEQTLLSIDIPYVLPDGEIETLTVEGPRATLGARVGAAIAAKNALHWDRASRNYQILGGDAWYTDENGERRESPQISYNPLAQIDTYAQMLEAVADPGNNTNSVEAFAVMDMLGFNATAIALLIGGRYSRRVYELLEGDLWYTDENGEDRGYPLRSLSPDDLLRVWSQRCYQPDPDGVLEPDEISVASLPQLAYALLGPFFQRLGLRNFPAKVPQTLLKTEDEDSVEPTLEPKEDLLSFVAWIVEQVDALVGEFPIKITIEDMDPLTEGNQTEEISLANIAEAIAELYGLGQVSSSNSGLGLNFLTRLSGEILATKISSLITQEYAKSNAQFLGYRGNAVSRKVNNNFDIDHTDHFYKLLRNKEDTYIGWKSEDKESVANYLQAIQFAAGIIKAALFLTGDQAERITEGVEGMSSDLEENRTRWEQFKDAVNDPERLMNNPDPEQYTPKPEITDHPVGNADGDHY